MPRTRRDFHTFGLLAVALAALLWAVAATMARSLFDDGVPPVELAASRAWVACAGLALLRPWRVSPADPMPRSKLLGLGIAIAMVNAVYYVAIQRLDVAVAIVLEYTAPALVVMWVSFGNRKVPSAPVLGALAAAVLGVWLLSEVGTVDVSDLDGIGLSAGLASAFFFAAYTLLSEQANRHYGPVGAMFRAFAVTSAFWLVVQVFRGWPAELFDPDNVARVAYVGVMGTIVPFLLYVWGIGHVASERASIGATLEPALAAAIAWVWLDQRLSAWQIAGGLLVLGAVAALQLERKEPVIAPEP
jgi:DME family drug/metabolite transporter